MSNTDQDKLQLLIQKHSFQSTAQSIAAQFDNHGNLIKLGIKGLRNVPFPLEIFDFSNLLMLELLQCKIKKLPSEISRLTNLNSLYLSSNQIESLPPEIGQLSKLVLLDISYNQLKLIPQEIGKLKLDTSKNDMYINRLFSGFGANRGLTIDNNPLQTPPLEIAVKGCQAIANYYAQINSEGIDQLYEAKLIIIGEGGAGKTTLTKKIRNPDYNLEYEEKSTLGIDVEKWKFEISKEKQFQVNIWDFGGQEIYHATHQFFLTKRSLYILVADSRKEDTDFYYWLNIVEILSENSPVLIIKNEKQDRQRDINERQLRGRFPNLEKILAANFATNRGVREILAEIKNQISQLPHVGTSLPKSWIEVRKILENDKRDYISLEDYFNICKNNGFSQQKDTFQLSGYLHDLGVCLHFQQDPLLSKILILKPEWGTDAVYKVLDSKLVIDNKGKFNLANLSEIWREEKYKYMHAELLRLMINFRLCYQIPGSDNFIAPQLLPENQPQYAEWSSVDNLIVRYTYDFMPKGIVSQLMVILNNLIIDQRYIWKSGLVLQKGGASAEIIEDYDRREIKIRVVGKNKKELMTIVTYEIDKINSTYSRLKVNKLIPCNCKTCTDLKQPHYYIFETLRSFLEDNQREIQCQNKPYLMVDVLSLIDDVIGKEYFLEQSKREGRVISFASPVERVIIQNAEFGYNVLEETMSKNKIIEIGDNAKISAPIVIADNIENSFNALSNAQVDDEVRKLLEHLIKAVAEVNSKVSLDKSNEAESMARDTETLVKEASSSKPRRQWYEVSLEGLKQAAINIGEVAKPVLTIVEKLIPLLISA